MKSCSAVYFTLGAQLCTYIGFECPYQGDRAVMELSGEQGVVTYCTLNDIERLIDKEFLDD